MNTYTAIIPPEGGDEHSAGAVSHEFTSPDLECATALCDAHGWVLKGELLGTVESANDDWKKPELVKEPKRKPRRNQQSHVPTGQKVLNKAQKATLGQLAATAFNHMDKYGLIEDVDESLSRTKQCLVWRRTIVKNLTGKDSLTKCQNSDFRKIEAEFLKLGGKKYENPKAFQTGKQTAAKEDTMENRERALWLINDLLTDHHSLLCAAAKEDQAITQNYLLSIAKAQNKSTPLADYDALLVLPAATLWQLLYTCKNRIASRERKLGLRE